MSECRNTKYRELIHAYELGLLSGDLLAEFEQHLIECDQCAADVEAFASLARAVVSDSELKGIVAGALAPAEDVEPSVGQLSVPPAKRRIWRTLVPTLAAAAVLILLILKDWQLEFKPSQEAIAAPKILAILYFSEDVRAEGDLRLGEIITDLLITDMSESGFFRVVSSQRLYDLVRQLGGEEGQYPGEETATKVAKEAAATWMLTGRVVGIAPQVVLTSQLVDVNSGTVLSSQKIVGDTSETVFEMVDRLSAEVKEDLLLPSEAYQEDDPRIASATTHSIEAYRLYLRGRDSWYKAYFEDAEAALRMSLEQDTTFAMPYVLLATIKWLDADPEAATLIAKAVQYRDRASRKEQWWIRGVDAGLRRDFQECAEWFARIKNGYPDDKTAYYWLAWVYRNFLDRNSDAIGLLVRAIELDPEFKNAYGLLARAYESADSLDRAMWSVNEYIRLAPTEAYPYVRRADIYRLRDQVNEAIESYERAIELRPDFDVAHERVASLYLYVGDYEKARRTFQTQTANPGKGKRSDARTGLALVPLCQGKFNEALTVLDDGIGADRLEGATHGDEGDRAFKHLIKARIFVAQGNLEQVTAELEAYYEVVKDLTAENKTYCRLNMVELYCQLGEIGRAEEAYDRLQSEAPATGTGGFYKAWAAGILDLAKGDAQGALRRLERFASGDVNFQLGVLLARVYFESGQYRKAIDLYESLLQYHDLWPFYLAIDRVKVYYHLGRSYEAFGDSGAAVNSYQRFVDLWRNADVQLVEVENARERMARLNSQE